MKCGHTGSYSALGPIPIQVGEGGALLVTTVVCRECGEIEYRSPPLLRDDEKALEERVQENNRRRDILIGRNQPPNVRELKH